MGNIEHWTRRELATAVSALDEFRETGVPELARRIDAVLRGPGERFVIVPAEQLEGADPDTGRGQ